MTDKSRDEEQKAFGLASIYKGLWKCRDLEIQMLWTRLTLLGAIMALTYTGYGVLLMKMLETSTLNWNVSNLLAIMCCVCGMVFSCLWLTTAKGSKRWFEKYEAAIAYFQEANRDTFEPFKNGDRCASYLDFGKPEITSRQQPSDDSLLSSCAGRFSVSKIPIVFGQLSMIGWTLISFIHLAALFLGRAGVKMLTERLGLQFGAFLLLLAFFTISVVCSRIKSSCE